MTDTANETTRLKLWLAEHGVPDHLVLPLLRSHTPDQIRNGIRAGLAQHITPEQAANRILAGQFGVKSNLVHATRPPDWGRGTRTGGEIPSPVKQQPLSKQELLDREVNPDILSELPQIP